MKDDQQVKQQINQMVSFIRQEADEKANEIRVKAEEDFNIRKLSAVESAREKIREEYERKTKQIQVNQKIAYSTANSESRLKVLKFEDQAIREIYDEAASKLRDVAKDSSKYSSLLQNLTLQGLLTLKDPEVALLVKENDKKVVDGFLSDVVKAYKQATGDEISVEVAKETLPEDSLGGVTLKSHEGKIKLDNTFESRLDITYESNLPYFREVLGFNKEN
eukprot:Plantae.Rhodophyta-Purpureofilum_apyrenoidigerum.ctg6694.p1 GENE.Plantae.Rhodophyta-Purpureofilum_apyrenoidigerum.ctg6694~~Plantae.Rhodophyta-Purpureofilum_apyrenoidigerum.ctg6694.p1  ORF type:complete len:220 (-),score=64.02 Plantae.Rhodophyta-Purpureofilum_apyrenoidigerum.ctg6694:686-1345(-)